MKITKQYIWGYSPFCSYLKTKESYNWWITMRKWGIRHQISEAKYQKMSVANILKHSGEISQAHKMTMKFHRRTRCCEIILQPKADFAALRNWPSTWCDRLPMALTSSFQLRFMHRLKHWIVDFLSFETTIACINWTPGSTPKVSDMTVIKNARRKNRGI